MNKDRYILDSSVCNRVRRLPICTSNFKLIDGLPNWPKKMIEELLSSPSHTIRFTAHDDTHKDYEMSREEYEALSVISNFQDVRNILSDLLFWFQESQSSK